MSQSHSLSDVLQKAGPDDPSMFTAGDFDMLKYFLFPLENGFSDNLAFLQIHMKNFERQIFELFRVQPASFQDSITILLQGYNFFARLIGSSEYLLPAFINELNDKQVESESQHCAICISAPDSSPYLSLPSFKMEHMNLAPKMKKVYSKETLLVTIFLQVFLEK